MSDLTLLWLEGQELFVMLYLSFIFWVLVVDVVAATLIAALYPFMHRLHWRDQD